MNKALPSLVSLLRLCSMLHLQKLYIVCDVALFVIANKSTACHLDSPKEPVLPSKFFLLQDKARHTPTLDAV